MSTAAIAAVTATLRSVLQNAVDRLPGGGTVTTFPLDKAEPVGDARRVNLFLYQTTLNAAWRNQPMPTKVRPSENGYPPLALNLHYLVTAYGNNEVDEDDHRLLGAAMLAFHDRGILSPLDIQNATSMSEALKSAALDQQFENVKITHESLTLEELSKLWTTFQAKYRVSAAYQASVVLIESENDRPSPLPVLKRGADDRGVETTLQFPPELNGIEYRDLPPSGFPAPPAFPSAKLGDTVTLVGARFPLRNAEVVFRDPKRTGDTPDLKLGAEVGRLKPRADSTSESVYALLDESQGNWVCGQLNVSIEFTTEQGQKRNSNPLRFALAPDLGSGGKFAFVIRVEAGKRKLVLNCRPRMPQLKNGEFPEVSLLLTPVGAGDSPSPIALDRKSPSISPTTPVFVVDQVPPGQYRVRLRVDTVESLIMTRSGTRLDFDNQQMVTL